MKTDSGIERRPVTFRKTHHGPIIVTRNGRPLALRMSKLEAEGWLAEWYAMTHARSIAELRRAMRPLNMLFGNVMAADALRGRPAESAGARHGRLEWHDGPTVKRLAVHTMGESGDPTSPHFFDQAPLYARGRFRPAWFTLEGIRANLEREYRPGQLGR